MCTFFCFTLTWIELCLFWEFNYYAATLRAHSLEDILFGECNVEIGFFVIERKRFIKDLTENLVIK